MKKVYIVHGYGGYPDKNWFPSVKSELENLGIETEVLSMPNSDNPIFSEWLSFMQSKIKPNEDTCLVGHSLGCIAILQYLNNLDAGTKTKGAVLVAGFASPIHFSELDGFFETPLNEEKIKSNTGKIVAISSDNDPHIPYHQAEELRDRFNAELILIPNGGHLNEKSGYTEFPLVVEKVKNIFGL